MVFHYDDLSDEEFQIRLFTIDPANSIHDSFHVHLRTFSLSSKPEYQALSYTWGRPAPHLPDDWDDPAATKTVRVNGEPFQVRYNLFSALQTIGQTWKSHVRWWVDAICINQDDVSERNSQVAHMKEICASTQLAVIWLGPGDEMSDLAFSEIAFLSKSWEQRPQYLKGRILNKDIPEYTEILRNEFSDEESLRSWLALRSLSVRSWFQRAWVVQEFCVASATLVQCGDRMVAWADLVNTRRVIVQHCICMKKATDFKMVGAEEEVSSLLMLTHSWQKLSEILFRYHNNTSTTASSCLVTALNQLRSNEATDARDKVYAARGLAGAEAQMVPVNYDLPIGTVYANVAKSLIQRSKTFHVLAYCHYPPKTKYLPTWAADWSDESRAQRIALPQKDFNHYESENLIPVYRTTKESNFFVRFGNGGRKMVVRAAALGKLSFTSSPGMCKYETSEPARRNGLGIYAMAQIAEEASKAARDYNDIALKAKWLRDWASSESALKTSSFPMIDRTGWTFDHKAGNEIFVVPTYSPTHENLLEAYLRTLPADVMRDQAKGQDIRIPSSRVYVDNIKAQEASLAEALSLRLEGKAFAVSELGFIALVPAEARVDDLIVIVQDSELPFILRPLGDKFLFIGQAYVHGIMDGQIWSLVEDGSLSLEEISII